MYVVGVLMGDGTAYVTRNSKNSRARAYRIALGNVVDRSFAESFKSALERIGVKAKIYEYNGHWSVVASSKKTGQLV